jgi:hypothetical protein
VDRSVTTPSTCQRIAGDPSWSLGLRTRRRPREGAKDARRRAPIERGAAAMPAGDSPRSIRPKKGRVPGAWGLTAMIGHTRQVR